jgi:hypothetical protein
MATASEEHLRQKKGQYIEFHQETHPLLETYEAEEDLLLPYQ